MNIGNKNSLVSVKNCISILLVSICLIIGDIFKINSLRIFSCGINKAISFIDYTLKLLKKAPQSKLDKTCCLISLLPKYILK